MTSRRLPRWLWRTGFRDCLPAAATDASPLRLIRWVSWGQGGEDPSQAVSLSATRTRGPYATPAHHSTPWLAGLGAGRRTARQPRSLAAISGRRGWPVRWPGKPSPVLHACSPPICSQYVQAWKSCLCSVACALPDPFPRSLPRAPSPRISVSMRPDHRRVRWHNASLRYRPQLMPDGLRLTCWLRSVTARSAEVRERARQNRTVWSESWLAWVPVAIAVESVRRSGPDRFVRLASGRRWRIVVVLDHALPPPRCF